MANFLVVSPQFMMICGTDGSICTPRARSENRTLQRDIESQHPDGLIFLAFTGMEVLGWASELKNSADLRRLPIAIIGKSEELTGRSEGDVTSCSRLAARFDVLTEHRTNSASAVKKVVVDQRSREIVVNGQRKTCSPAEFRILLLFLRYPDIVFSREALLEHTRVADSRIDSNMVDVLISRIRHKMQIHPQTHANVRTVRGLGYVFDRNSDCFIDALTQRPFVYWPRLAAIVTFLSLNIHAANIW
jgi:DNA-binding response OmpR family regulator